MSMTLTLTMSLSQSALPPLAGVVPRSFLGPMLLAVCSTPFVGIASLAGASKLSALYLVRCMLGLLSTSGLLQVMRATRRQYGYDAFRAFGVLSALQFHWLFYSSRTLPNTFASLLVSRATARFIDSDLDTALRYLTVATVVFRSEIVLLVAPLALLALGTRRIGFIALVRLGVLTGTSSRAHALRRASPGSTPKPVRGTRPTALFQTRAHPT